MTHATARNDSVVGRLADDELVDLAKRGNEEAVRVLVRRHNRLLFRTARAIMRDDAEAEDVVQETYVRAFTSLDRFRGESALSTWLSRIAMNEALGRLRKKRPMASLATLETAGSTAENQVILFPTLSASAGPDAETAREQVRQVLERMVDRLPEHFRIVFILRDVEGMTTDETAEHLSLRPETVKTRLHRARKLMRISIERELSSGFADLFPFGGDRCKHMAGRVVARLRQVPGGGSP